MDQTLILELSSDDEVGFDNSSSADNFDWITKLFEDVDDEDFNANFNGGLINNSGCNDDDDDDSDDVVVVGEVIVQNPKKEKPLLPRNDDNDDDDCVLLDGDPNNSKDEVKDSKKEDSDELLIVGEKGQVACRDYPHARHLCAKFPFSSTPHESRCDLCHCYVCDSLAPCAHWGSGVSDIDHCHATDKEERWKLERKRFRQLKNPPSPMPITKPDAGSMSQFQQMQQMSTGPNKSLRRTCTFGASSTFGVPNILRSQRSSIAVTSNRLQPHINSRHLLRTCNSSTQIQGNRGASLAPRMVSSRPMFKRPGLVSSRPVVANQSAYRLRSNVNVPYVKMADPQLMRNITENNSSNSTVSSLRMETHPSFSPSSTSSIPPLGLPLQLQGCSQPSPQTPSHVHGYSHSSAVVSNSPYTSMNQLQNVPGLVLPGNTTYCSEQNVPGLVLPGNTTHCSEQHSAETQNISGPNFSCSNPDVRSSVTPRSHQISAEQSYSSPIFSCSTLNGPNGVSQSCQQSAVENSLVRGVVPIHEFLPSMEQNPPPLDNAEQVDIDFEKWLQDNESILGSQDEPFLFDTDNQASVPAPVDAGMLYFDFETSWKGLAHS